MPSRPVNLMTEKPVACCRPILSRLHDKKADTTTGQLPSPDPARTQLPSSPWQLLQCPPPPSTTSTPKGPAPYPTSCSLGKPAGLRRMRRMQAGRQGGSGPALWALTICTGHIASVQPRQPTVQTVGSFGLSPSSGTTCSLTLNEAIVPPWINVREKVG